MIFRSGDRINRDRELRIKTKETGFLLIMRAVTKYAAKNPVSDRSRASGRVRQER